MTDIAAERRVIERAYAAFNARDLDAALQLLHPEVDWPNLIDGVREHGREAVRAYWQRQFAAFDPRVVPLAIAATGDGRVAVDVDQVVRALDGRELRSSRVRHVYAFADGLVRRLDVEAAAGA
jgi:ketosteroid isomerase-like protein